MIPQHTGLSMVDPCSHPGAPNFSDSFRGDVGILVSQAPGAHPAASTLCASKWGFWSGRLYWLYVIFRSKSLQSSDFSGHNCIQLSQMSIFPEAIWNFGRCFSNSSERFFPYDERYAVFDGDLQSFHVLDKSETRGTLPTPWANRRRGAKTCGNWGMARKDDSLLDFADIFWAMYLHICFYLLLCVLKLYNIMYIYIHTIHIVEFRGSKSIIESSNHVHP